MVFMQGFHKGTAHLELTWATQTDIAVFTHCKMLQTNGGSLTQKILTGITKPNGFTGGYATEKGRNITFIHTMDVYILQQMA